MSDWQRSGLCLCRSDELAGAGFCQRSEARQWSWGVGANRRASGGADVLILETCRQALKQRLKAARAQVLILYDESGAGDVTTAEACAGEIWTQAVEVCALEHIGHVEVLLALAMGFDRVLLQQSSALDTAAVQAQEIELARAMGGGSRLDIFASAKQLCSGLAAASKMAGRWRTSPPAIVASRQGTARACAAVLMTEGYGATPLPVDAPYGTLQLDVSACTKCQSCVWLCPTDALSLGDRTSDLLFVESHCIQCGMCRSICPENALQLEPRILSSPDADTRKSLHQAAPLYCLSCGDPVTGSRVMDRLLTRFLGSGLRPASPVRQRSARLCRTCRARESQQARNRLLAKAELMHSEPRRGR
ncbi:4Fe-4S dicluster domain-containing protein [Parasedimentitalea psychrophila]|uniref:4Fe-4S binding protein n=1 Tax=Parasedimentitalea psychrophila TaxID=2997337 RepID=A0A9Y2P6Z9_9RHOB|nr:4Fe-4S binding protein [Parasedimentitalea psychrophila]WIY25260.1 4Fe-4S binding protein [Parasedimentitalea psychrophila]